MKKVLTAIALLALAAVPASQAYISITWSASWGFYSPADGTSPLLGVGQSALVELINANGDGADPVNLLGANYLGGNDTLLLPAVTFTNTGNNGFNEWVAVTLGTYTSANATLTFYARIFQDATPAGNEKYYDSAVFTATQWPASPGTDTDFFDMNKTTGGETNPSDGDQLTNTIQPIPEPATVAFLGFGLVGLAARALRRRA